MTKIKAFGDNEAMEDAVAAETNGPSAMPGGAEVKSQPIETKMVTPEGEMQPVNATNQMLGQTTPTPVANRSFWQGLLSLFRK